MILLDGKHLTIEAVVRAVRENENVALDPQQLRGCSKP